MTTDDAAASSRLLALLAPLHDRALATARRLCRCNAEGDDLFQETVLRAFDRLEDLRDVGRADGTITVKLGAQDGQGHRLEIMQQVNGAQSNRLQIEPEPIDNRRDPGMTDEQLRDKISAQLRARGFNAAVTVNGDRIEIRAMKFEH